MIRRTLLSTLIAVLGAAPVVAQTPLNLEQAIDRARTRNPGARVAVVAEREAAQRVTQARAGYFPKVDLVESWQRANQPVFVFSSLLSQKQFTASNFAIDALNHPDALDNFKTAVAVEQPVFDRATRAKVAAAVKRRKSRRSTGVAWGSDIAWLKKRREIHYRTNGFHGTYSSYTLSARFPVCESHSAHNNPTSCRRGSRSRSRTACPPSDRRPS